ncbi:hypothetical protein Tco_0265936 [Tanacetum coccineum]
MSNTNTNLQTQTSNALHNAIIEAGGKDRPPMLAPDQLNAEAEAIQIILTGIDNDIYSTVDACPNACEMWKAIERLKQALTLITTRMAKNEVNKIRAERLARTANPLALVAQQQPVYHPQNHANHYTQNCSTKSQQAATRNKGKAIINSPPPTYDQEPEMVAEDDELSKENEIDKLMALISLSYKPTNNNLRTSSNTSRANQDNSLRINRGTGYDNKRAVNVVGARENVGTQVVQQSGIQCYNCKEYVHVAKECQKPKRAKDAAYHKEKMLLTSCKPESVNDTYLVEQGDTNITIDSLDMSTNGETVDQDDDDLANERDLLASLLDKLKCEIDDSKNRNKFLESSNKTLVDKLKGEIEDFKNINKSLELSCNHFKETNNELSKTNQLMFKDLKKFQDELEKRHDVNYMSKVELECAKAKTELMSYKTESQKSINNYSYQINDLNQKIFDMKKELVAHQETIAIMSQQKEDQTKTYKTREEKELKKAIALKNKIKFLKKAQRANPRLYDIGCYNDNLALMLAPESDETIQEMVADLRYFNSLKNEVNFLKSQMDTQRTQFLNEIDRLSREYYYADHMNAILGVYTTLDEFTDL